LEESFGGVYKHSAGEGWANDICLPKTLYYSRMDHIASAPDTKTVTQVDYTAVFANSDIKKTLPTSFICLDKDMNANLAHISAG
jgi:hypothetical protein